MTGGFVDHLTDLAQTAGIALRFKRMFGGHGVYRDDRMIGLMADEVLYLKVDAVSQPLFAEVGSAPFTYAGKGKPIVMSYWRCPESALDDPDDLRLWLRRAMEAAARAAAARPMTPRRRSRKSP